MRTRRIGQLEVSEVGLGCNNFGGRMDWPATRDVVAASLDAGVTFFDTADIYGGTLSEEYVGRALGRHRDEVVVATKFGMRINDERPGGASAEYLRQRLEDSLRRLGTDYVDLYQIHQPDPDVPIGETLAELDAQVRRGTVREIGCSNFSAEQLAEAAQATGPEAARLVSVQNEYSLLERAPESGVLEACARLDLAFLPFYPLAMGTLSGKYRRGQAPAPGTRLAVVPAERAEPALSEDRLRAVDALGALANESDHSVLDLAIGWLLTRAAVASVIAGASSPEQVRQNVAAADFRPDPALLERVDGIVPPPTS